MTDATRAAAVELDASPVRDQVTVFGAYGAVVFTLLSGLLFARFKSARAQAA